MSTEYRTKLIRRAVDANTSPAAPATVLQVRTLHNFFASPLCVDIAYLKVIERCEWAIGGLITEDAFSKVLSGGPSSSLSSHMSPNSDLLNDSSDPFPQNTSSNNQHIGSTNVFNIESNGIENMNPTSSEGIDRVITKCIILLKSNLLSFYPSDHVLAALDRFAYKMQISIKEYAQSFSYIRALIDSISRSRHAASNETVAVNVVPLITGIETSQITPNLSDVISTTSTVSGNNIGHTAKSKITSTSPTPVYAGNTNNTPPRMATQREMVLAKSIKSITANLLAARIPNRANSLLDTLFSSSIFSGHVPQRLIDLLVSAKPTIFSSLNGSRNSKPSTGVLGSPLVIPLIVHQQVSQPAGPPSSQSENSASSTKRKIDKEPKPQSHSGSVDNTPSGDSKGSKPSTTSIKSPGSAESNPSSTSSASQGTSHTSMTPASGNFPNIKLAPNQVPGLVLPITDSAPKAQYVHHVKKGSRHNNSRGGSSDREGSSSSNGNGDSSLIVLPHDPADVGLWSISDLDVRERVATVSSSKKMEERAVYKTYQRGTMLFQYKHYKDQSNLNISKDHLDMVVTSLISSPNMESRLCASKIMIKLLVDSFCTEPLDIASSGLLSLLYEMLEPHQKLDTKNHAFNLLFNLSVHLNMFEEVIFLPTELDYINNSSVANSGPLVSGMPISHENSGWSILSSVLSGNSGLFSSDSDSDSSESNSDSNDQKNTSQRRFSRSSSSSASSVTSSITSSTTNPEFESSDFGEFGSGQKVALGTTPLMSKLQLELLHILKELLLVLVTQHETSKKLWFSGLNLLLYFLTDSGFISCEKLVGLDPRVIAGFFTYIDYINESVWRHLVRLLCNILYQDQLTSTKKLGNPTTAFINQLQLLGSGSASLSSIASSTSKHIRGTAKAGIQFIIDLYKRSRSMEAKDNLWHVIYDYIHFSWKRRTSAFRSTRNHGQLPISSDALGNSGMTTAGASQQFSFILDALTVIEAPQYFQSLFILTPPNFVQHITDRLHFAAQYHAELQLLMNQIDMTLLRQVLVDFALLAEMTCESLSPSFDQACTQMLHEAVHIHTSHLDSVAVMCLTKKEKKSDDKKPPSPTISDPEEFLLSRLTSNLVDDTDTPTSQFTTNLSILDKLLRGMNTSNTEARPTEDSMNAMFEARAAREWLRRLMQPVWNHQLGLFNLHPINLSSTMTSLPSPTSSSGTTSIVNPTPAVPNSSAPSANIPQASLNKLKTPAQASSHPLPRKKEKDSLTANPQSSSTSSVRPRSASQASAAWKYLHLQHYQIPSKYLLSTVEARFSELLKSPNPKSRLSYLELTLSGIRYIFSLSEQPYMTNFNASAVIASLSNAGLHSSSSYSSSINRELSQTHSSSTLNSTQINKSPRTSRVHGSAQLSSSSLPSLLISPSGPKAFMLDPGILTTKAIELMNMNFKQVCNVAKEKNETNLQKMFDILFDIISLVPLSHRREARFLAEFLGDDTMRKYKSIQLSGHPNQQLSVKSIQELSAIQSDAHRQSGSQDSAIPGSVKVQQRDKTPNAFNFNSITDHTSTVHDDNQNLGDQQEAPTTEGTQEHHHFGNQDHTDKSPDQNTQGQNSVDPLESQLRVPTTNTTTLGIHSSNSSSNVNVSNFATGTTTTSTIPLATNKAPNSATIVAGDTSKTTSQLPSMSRSELEPITASIDFDPTCPINLVGMNAIDLNKEDDSPAGLFLKGQAQVIRSLLAQIDISILLHLFTHLPPRMNSSTRPVVLHLIIDRCKSSEADLEAVGGSALFKRLLIENDPLISYLASRFLIDKLQKEQPENFNTIVNTLLEKAVEMNDEKMVSNPYLQIKAIFEMNSTLRRKEVFPL